MLDGNVPTALQHWPEPCPGCAAPPPAEPSDRVDVEVHRVIRRAAGGAAYRPVTYHMAGHEFAGRLLDYLGKARPS